MNTNTKQHDNPPSPPSRGIKKLATGISGFDEVSLGGIPKGRSTLVSGSTGTGKTVFAAQFLVEGVARDEHGVFVTFEERPKDIIRNMDGFGWDLQEMRDNNQLAFVDASPEDYETVEMGNFDLGGLIARVKHAIDKVDAERVAIDSISAFFPRYSNEGVIRHELHKLITTLKDIGVTVIITAERTSQNIDDISRFGVEEFVSDNVVLLGRQPGELTEVRDIEILKFRGTDYQSGTVNFSITEDGIEVFPKIPVDRRVAKTDFKKRKSSGIPEFDEMLSGGYPQGHTVLISGNTGTGKTTFGLRFLLEGLKNGENGVFLAFEESVAQLKKTAAEHGWDLEQYEESGELTFLNPSLIDISSNKLLYEIVDTLDSNDAKRFVVDSISSMESATINKDRLREFLLQLNFYLKSRGITSILTYLSGGSFTSQSGNLLGAETGSDLRLSSIVDAIVLMQYTELDQTVRRLITVLKLRGSAHDKRIYEFSISQDGISIGEQFNTAK